MQAFRISTYGRPGAVYLDFPAEMIDGKAAADKVR